MNKLGEVMDRIRETIYGLYPQTFGYTLINLKNDNKTIQGIMDVNMIGTTTKRVSIYYDYKEDSIEIKEVCKTSEK